MEPQEYIELLKRSTEDWNEWREQSPQIIPFLQEADLSNTHLKDANFKKAILKRADFRGAYLRGANFENANLERAIFRMADLGGANLRFANLYKANFRRADLWKANLSFTNLKAANLGKAIMQQIILEGANLESALLVEADLTGANLHSADLRGADLSRANLSRANLKDAILEGAIMTDANLEGALFKPRVSEIKEMPAQNVEAAIISAKKGVEAYAPGASFGPYEIREQIARGGMGIVYLAYDKSLQREVAIKILSSELRENPEYLQRFLQEARITAQMDHPNIINIYAISEEKGELYVAMQYIKGKNIAQLLREKGNFDFFEALIIARCVASALAYAHRQGLIHRDIKPDNIMIDENKRVHVMDFGIARDLTLKNRITQDGQFMGTIHYSAPEQWSSDVPDPRSDIYSLGVVLYEMLIGKIPFDADSPMNLLYKITKEEPIPIRELRSDTPPEIDEIITRMLAKDLERRYFKAEEAVEDIDQIIEAMDLSAKKDSDLLSITDINALLREKPSTTSFIDTPTNLLIRFDDMSFSSKPKKKFLKLKQNESIIRKLGDGWLYVLFQETLLHNCGKDSFNEQFPILSKARKGRQIEEEEVVLLNDEIYNAVKILEQLALTEIWTLSIDTKSRETIARKIHQDELQKVTSEFHQGKMVSDFQNVKDFFEPILGSYRDVCEKAIDNRTGAQWT